MKLYRAHVLVCAGANCSLNESKGVIKALESELVAKGLDKEVKVVETGCFGLCEAGPNMVVYPEGIIYSGVKVEDVAEIVEEHLLKGRTVDRLVYKEAVSSDPVRYGKTDFINKQQRIVLRNAGVINPEIIEEYIARGGYEALGKCVTTMKPEEVIEVVKASGLRGRGGAGFPTGVKWGFTLKAEADQKYIVCNADEGEPGTNKDRLILEGDPHSIIEGMAIAGYAVGATKGYVYIRGEYTLSIKRLQLAINKARELGLLGDNIFGSGFSFDIEVYSGAGAYVCGEETALIESIEGKRGEPRFKPPYPGVKGLWGKPTVVNNVETLANIAPIIANGPEWFKQFGTPSCPGTKVFTLIGDINNKGLIEVPMGITLREIIYEIGGGIPDGKGFKMCQTGGSSGGCLSVEHLDVPMDYDTLPQYDSALGSGALLFMDDTHCIIDIVKNFMHFFVHESCGKCTPCREGTMRLWEFYDKIASGQGEAKDLEILASLSRTMQKAALCGLGQAAPTSVVSTLKYFRDEYDQHIFDKKCATGVCKMA